MLYGNRPGKRRRPVAPERPIDAPPVDYGGRHPFDVTGRRLQQQDTLLHEPIRISFDTQILESFLQASLNTQSYVVATRVFLLLYEIIPQTAAIWGDVLKVIPVQGVLYPLGSSQSKDKGGFCPTDKTAGIPDAGTDLWIYVTLDRYFCNQEGPTSGKVASALSCERDQFDRPVTGSIDFCLANMGQILPMTNITEIVNAMTESNSTRASLAKTDSNYAVVQRVIQSTKREIGQILGVSLDSLPYFRNALTGEPLTPRPFVISTVSCTSGVDQVLLGAPSTTILRKVVDDNGMPHFEIISPLVQRVVQNHFNCPTLMGARLEKAQGAGDCFGNHFDERMFYSDLMGAFLSPTGNALSPLALAFLEDSSWYEANYESDYVSVSSFGHLAGCEFVDGNCLVNGAVPSYGEGNFCNATLELTEDGFVLEQALPQTCDPSYRYKAHCDLRVAKPGEELPPAVKSYFLDNPQDAKIPYTFTGADYCPIPSLQTTDCTDRAAQFIVSKEYADSRERFGPASMCIDVTTRDRAICLESICNEQLQKLQLVVLYGINVTCEYDGQILTLLGGTDPFKVKCPRLAQACPELMCPRSCSGRGQCIVDPKTGRGKCRCLDFADKTNGCYNTSLSHVYKVAPDTALDHSANTRQANLFVFLLVVAIPVTFLLLAQFVSRVRLDRLRHSVKPDERRGWREMLFGKRYRHVTTVAKPLEAESDSYPQGGHVHYGGRGPIMTTNMQHHNMT
jgi:Leishmanolysin